MKRTTKLALVAGSVLTIALTAAAVNADPQSGWGPSTGYGMGPGYQMGYDMSPGGHTGYGMGPGGHMGYRLGLGGHMAHGTGLNSVLYGSPDAVGERLDALKSTLGITDSQQGAWQGFADSAKKQVEDRRAWFDKMHRSQAPLTSPDWLAERNEAMKQHQADNESAATTLRELYDVLTPEQRSVLDGGALAQGPRYGRQGR